MVDFQCVLVGVDVGVCVRDGVCVRGVGFRCVGGNSYGEATMSMLPKLLQRTATHCNTLQ